MQFVWIAAGKEHLYHLQPLIGLANMHQKYVRTMCYNSHNVVPKFDTSEMFSVIKLIVKMLKNTLLRIWVYDFSFS